MKGSDLIIGGVNLKYFKCRKFFFKRVGLYIDSPDWIKKNNKSKK